ncbi:MAG: hypothetical protein ACOYOF_01370 [Verrucomicrobiaceae bacterium]
MIALDTLYQLCLDEVKPKVIDALADGRAQIINGVARKAGSKTILQHLPFKPVAGIDEKGLPHSLRTLADKAGVSLPASQMQMMLGIATAASMATTIACTAYLASRIADIERQIATLSHAVESMTRLLLLDRFCSYVASAKSLHQLLSSAAVEKENRDLIALGLSRMAQDRHHLLSFISQVRCSYDQLDQRTQVLVNEFALSAMNLYPQIVLVELRAAYSLKKWALGEHIRQEALRVYQLEVSDYKTWATKGLETMLKGQAGEAERWIANRLPDIKRTLSPSNALLLQYST